MLKKVLKNIGLVFLVSYVFCFLMEYQPKYNIFLLAFSFVFIITSELIDSNKKNINNEILSENIGSKEKENEKIQQITLRFNCSRKIYRFMGKSDNSHWNPRLRVYHSHRRHQNSYRNICEWKISKKKI